MQCKILFLGNQYCLIQKSQYNIWSSKYFASIWQSGLKSTGGDNRSSGSLHVMVAPVSSLEVHPEVAPNFNLQETSSYCADQKPQTPSKYSIFGFPWLCLTETIVNMHKSGKLFRDFRRSKLYTQWNNRAFLMLSKTDTETSKGAPP